MTENTPDAVRIAREVVRVNRQVTMDSADADMAQEWALLGARAMQAAMPAPAGVRVPTFPRYGHLPAREFLLLASYCGGDNDECTDARPCADCLAMCNVYAEDSQFLRSLGANPAKKACVPAPLYKRVEAILDEHSAWIARPNDEVTKRVALAAMFAAHSVLIEEGAPEERYLRDGAAPTPAGAGDLVERARTKAASRRLDDALSIGGAHDDGLLDALASRIEALEAEVAELRERTDKQWEVIEKDCYIGSSREKSMTARATTAEAERDALKAEVERKDKALREAGEAIAEYFRYLNGGETRGSYDGKPEREGLRKAGYAVSRALAPAKGG